MNFLPTPCIKTTPMTIRYHVLKTHTSSFLIISFFVTTHPRDPPRNLNLIPHSVSLLGFSLLPMALPHTQMLVLPLCCSPCIFTFSSTSIFRSHNTPLQFFQFHHTVALMSLMITDSLNAWRYLHLVMKGYTLATPTARQTDWLCTYSMTS